MARVVVCGSINMDFVVILDTHPMPGETILGKELKYFMGGKGCNQAVSASRLGADTVMIGQIGEDAFGDTMRTFLQSENIDTHHISTDSNVATGMALVTIDKQAENAIVVIPGANGTMKQQNIDTFVFTETDILVCQNEIPTDIMITAFERASVIGAKIIYNPAPAIKVPDVLFALADIIVVNESEYDFYQHYLQINTKTLIQTLGKKGVFVAEQGVQYGVSGRSVKAVDTTGAGDCFVGAIACRLSKGDTIKDAVTYANISASIAVTRHGASNGMPYAHEIEY